MRAKSARNKKILAAFKRGVTVYVIAKQHNLSWPRTKRIILQEQAREAAQ